MNAILTPRMLRGTVAALPSKSQAHRLLICAALAAGETVIECPAAGQDLEATVRCLRALGAKIEYNGTQYAVTPIETAENAVLDAGESGATLRFLLPVVCALGAECTFLLRGRLPQRPMEPLCAELRRHGAVIRQEDDRYFVSGKLTGCDYRLPADVSSQFLSGNLLALSVLGGGTLTMIGEVESAAYVEMTLDALRRFGVQADRSGNQITVHGTLKSPGHLTVEGDWSNAAFWLCADRLGSAVSVTGLDPESLQSDRRIPELTDAVDCSQSPDLVSPLAILAAFTPGRTDFFRAGRLRYKESDRIRTCVAMVRALGAEAEEAHDGFTVWGKEELPGGTVDACGDHRIAMAAAIAGTRCPVKILNAQAVEKSYAAFWSDYARLGGCVAWEDAT